MMQRKCLRTIVNLDSFYGIFLELSFAFPTHTMTNILLVKMCAKIYKVQILSYHKQHTNTYLMAKNLKKLKKNLKYHIWLTKTLITPNQFCISNFLAKYLEIKYLKNFLAFYFTFELFLKSKNLFRNFTFHIFFDIFLMFETRQAAWLKVYNFFIVSTIKIYLDI